jgi:hypothetical protein
MSNDNYIVQGIHIDRYHALEEDFLKFMEFITLDFYSLKELTKIKSTYLADLLLRIGSNVDVIYKKYLIENSEFTDIVGKKSENELNWDDCKKLESYIYLSETKTIIFPTLESICPFRNIEGISWIHIVQRDQTDFWWKSYNNIKHYGNFEEANMENVLRSLAALFLLISLTGGPTSNFVRYNYIHNSESSIVTFPDSKPGYILYTKLFILPSVMPPELCSVRI